MGTESAKIYLTEGDAPDSQIGAALESLARTIHDRRDAGEASYTYRLLEGKLDSLLKKLAEEAHETTLAAKDADYALYFAAEAASVGASEGQRAALASSAQAELDHLRYEAGDVVYHLMVVLERFGISMDEFAAELNSRMTEDEISLREGVALLKPQHVNRGK